MKSSYKVIGISIASSALAIAAIGTVWGQTPSGAGEQRVSVHFSNAPIDKVLDYLAKTDSNFVVSSGSVPKDARITLSIKNRPLSEVEKAIAVALGGHWTHVGNTLTFEPGTGMDGFFRFEPSGKAYNFNFDQSMSPDFEKSMKSFHDMFKSDDFKNSFGPEFEKSLKDAFGPEFQQKMERLKKELKDNPNDPKAKAEIEKEFGPDFQKKMEDAFGPEFQKKMEDLGEKMSKSFGDPNAWSGMKGLSPQQQKELQDQFKGLKPDKSFNFAFDGSEQDLPGLLKSLTQDQKDKMAKDGFLTPSDLTAKQLHMLGHLEGKYEIDISVHGDHLKVKSE